MTAMRTKIDCCRDCDKRTAGCHADCPDYARQNQELNEYREKRNAARGADAMIAAHVTAYKKKRRVKPKLD